MDKQVEKLVEWAANQIFIWHIGKPWMWEQDTYWEGPQREEYYEAASQILFHPDLALRDRTKPVKYDLETNTNYVAIIPLTEALKEGK